jgi:hypothetical protein
MVSDVPSATSKRGIPPPQAIFFLAELACWKNDITVSIREIDLSL